MMVCCMRLPHLMSRYCLPACDLSLRVETISSNENCMSSSWTEAKILLWCYTMYCVLHTQMFTCTCCLVSMVCKPLSPSVVNYIVRIRIEVVNLGNVFQKGHSSLVNGHQTLTRSSQVWAALKNQQVFMKKRTHIDSMNVCPHLTMMWKNLDPYIGSLEATSSDERDSRGT